MEVLANNIILQISKRIMNAIYFSLSIIFLINYSSSIKECPRDTPILKDGECISTFCHHFDFISQICTIANQYIEIQWLNNIRFFDKDSISHICTSSSENGELFLIAQGFTQQTAGDKYIFAFSEDGNGLFYYRDKNFNVNTFYSFETIALPDDKYQELYYPIEIGDLQYLLSTQTENEMILIDYKNKNFKIYNFNISTFFSDSVFALKGYDLDEKEKEYFTDYINCKNYLNTNKCFLGLRIFHINLTSITILSEKNEEIQVYNKAKMHCFQNDDLYIQCIYTKIEINEEGKEQYNRVISLFSNKNLDLKYNEILQENMNLDNTFESTIQLNGNIFVTGFSIPRNRNIIKLLLKKVVIKENEIKLDNYLPKIEYININEDNYYIIDRGLAKRNSMVKISDTKFAILLNEFTNSSLYGSFNKNLLILIFNIFDNSKISIRHYKINFELYNLLIFEDIKGYTLNNFFGVLLETIVTDTENYQPKAIFLTFGYVNSTYKDNFVDKNLKNNNTNSIVSIRYYLSEIENNLFAYKYIGVKILSLPPRLFSGYFINNKTNEEIKVGDMLSFDSNLRFILVRQIISGDLFNINFAVVVQEPDFDLMNNNAERVDIYPINDTNLEKEFYSPKNFIGRVIQYKFDLDCYDSCEGCFKLSNNPDDQQCIHCKKNYFFQEGTNNCFESKEGYYLDIKTKQLLPCHSSCSTCNGPQTKNSMNCLSCKEGLNLYESKNCLNCPKYVNYLQTECIDTIPDGYFLLYKNLGILGKCHKLCKTCEEAPTLSSMNCKECKYNDTDFIPSYEGECPNKENDGEEEEEEEIIMPEGKCPRSKPILVINDFCFDGYCSPEQFKDETCVISNSIIKDQWMNNIQRFGNGNTNFISLDYGFYGELFLFGQRRENSINQNNIYGVDKYGEPFFYNATNDKYYYYHNIDFPNDIFLEKVRFVRNYESDNIYLLSTQKKNEMYAVDYEADKNYIYKFDYTSYSTNDIIALNKNQKNL